MKKTAQRSRCPISTTLEILGDRWTLLVIRDLMFRGKRTYGEFLRSEERIATNILADRLLLLEEAGIIEKKAFPGNKAKNLYRLTPRGIDLMPVLLEIVLWGEKYFGTSSISEQARRLAEEVRKDRDHVIREVTRRLREDSAEPAPE